MFLGNCEIKKTAEGLAREIAPMQTATNSLLVAVSSDFIWEIMLNAKKKMLIVNSPLIRAAVTL